MNFWLLIVLAALGTFLLRWLPLSLGNRLLSGPTWLTLMLSALGLTAMTALVVVSAVDVWRQAPTSNTLLSMMLGTLMTLWVLRLTRNVGMAAIAGALSYGVVLSLF